ncbi:MAG: NAD(P)H-dependent oxidoreductase subunit E [Elusimicrobia bacterium]|nr:NAD(P)H-dependent oxidoreductase subunit E [Elusimicrobiota bacterium]
MEDRLKKEIDGIIEKHEGNHGALLGMLEDIQKNNPHNYLPEESLLYLAEKTKTPPSRIYGIITFYSFFSLVPEGRHCISICRGTACHTKGSKKLLDYIRENYRFENDTGGDAKLFITTEDRNLTLKTVACFGQCAMAPVIEVDGKIYGGVNINMLKDILKQIEGKQK